MSEQRLMLHEPADEAGTAKSLMLGHGAALADVPFRPVHDTVAGAAADHPTAVAVIDDEVRLSYLDLDRAACRLAAALADAGVGRGRRVALVADQSAAAVVGVVGILRASAAYVPIDATQPEARVAEFLADARVDAIVTTTGVRVPPIGPALPTIVLDRHGCVDAVARMGARQSSAPPVRVSDPAYLIYTSGSTGEPKGVVVEHGNLAASTLARRTVYPDRSVFLLMSRLAFDSSVAGLWGTLTTGGTLMVASADELRDTERLVGIVERHGVTSTLCTPSLYQVLLDAAEQVGVTRLRSLTTVIVAGEALPATLVDRHFAALPGVELVNEYGPTEATVWASLQRFDRPMPVTIGGPVPGVRLYVLDEQQRITPPGTDGELHIGGAGVARGYFRRPEATAGAFLPDPFAGGEARMYRTGDIVRWNDAGTLDFVGRRDDQVKIRGHRVELGAVAAGLRRLDEVREAAVVPDEHTRLVAFVVPAVASARPGIAAIRQAASQYLPAAMLPERICLLDNLPLTSSGKVDREHLRWLADRRDKTPPAERPRTFSPLGDRVTEQVAAAWSEVLDLSDVSVDANFFDLGGHSLATFKLQDALHHHAGVRPPLMALFQHTTVTAQAALIRASAAGAPPEDAR